VSEGLTNGFQRERIGTVGNLVDIPEDRLVVVHAVATVDPILVIAQLAVDLNGVNPSDANAVESNRGSEFVLCFACDFVSHGVPHFSLVGQCQRVNGCDSREYGSSADSSLA
jgi:hypothetical protein